MEPIAVLFNPSSGRGRSLKKRQEIELKFKENDIPFDWFTSESEDHLQDLARMTVGKYRLVVAVGGDTTFLMVATEFLGTENQPVLGMIGAGSANDIARGLGCLRVDQLCRNIKSGNKRSMDMGEIEVSGRPDKIHFLGTMSLGLGVEVNRFIAERRRRFPLLKKGGDIVQFLTGLWGIKHAFSKKMVPRNIRIKVDAQERDYDFSLMVMANSPYYANGLKMVPDADPFDGQLDCLILNSRNFWQVLYIGSRVKKSQHIYHQQVTCMRSRTFKFQSDDKFSIQYDGELLHDINDCRISVLPSVIQVLA